VRQSTVAMPAARSAAGPCCYSSEQHGVAKEKASDWYCGEIERGLSSNCQSRCRRGLSVGRRGTHARKSKERSGLSTGFVVGAYRCKGLHLARACRRTCSARAQGRSPVSVGIRPRPESELQKARPANATVLTSPARAQWAKYLRCRSSVAPVCSVGDPSSPVIAAQILYCSS
jgi:hypothetical protein